MIRASSSLNAPIKRLHKAIIRRRGTKKAGSFKAAKDWFGEVRQYFVTLGLVPAGVFACAAPAGMTVG
jgi:hypothetical protein